MIGNYTDEYEGTLLNTVNHKVYWRELRDRKPSVHYMTTDDYNWRWDVDGYYTTIDMGWFFNNELLPLEIGKHRYRFLDRKLLS